MATSKQIIETCQKLADSIKTTEEKITEISNQILVIEGTENQYINTANVRILQTTKNGSLYLVSRRLFYRYKNLDGVFDNFVREISPEKAIYKGFNPLNFIDLMFEVN